MLFLDEIGELGLDEQAMLLRAIEERRFLPVGSDTEMASDFQLLSGTNADLPAAVNAGWLRADLLNRIDLWTFSLPSGAANDSLKALLPEERLATLDLFDRFQLGAIVDVCRRSRSLSAAGRELFALSRQAKASPNDADRLRKYLARFGLTWHDVASR